MLAHFIWLDFGGDDRSRELSFNEFASIRTFMMHHPGWDVLLHTNSRFDGRLFDIVKGGLRIERVSASGHPDFIMRNMPVHRVDWLKLQILRKHGGIVLDLSDTVVMSRMDALVDAANNLTNAKMPDYPSTTSYPSGALMVARPGAAVFDIVEESLARSRHDRVGRGFFEGTMADLATARPDLLSTLPFSTFYPVGCTRFSPLIRDKSMKPYLYSDTVAVHWYLTSDNGISDPMIDARVRCVSAVDLDNYESLDNAYASCLREAVGFDDLRRPV
jgi:hypothetical protein